MARIETDYKTKIVQVEIPADANVIFGMSHFIKTVEDLYEALVSSSMSLKFGIAFCEASMKRLIRTDGNNPELIEMASSAAFDVACGHTFFIYLRDGFPINVLNRVKAVPEVCRIFCATANPLQVLIAETNQGRGVLGVIDGETPLGIETDDDKAERVEFLKKIGYKR
ncbi:MAG: adenosine-specific kinase [candidate division Zixibacteria bacterium]|nr:adenosine-specific kinase [candidate division Zixibacteria bacterium]MDH4032909.1 adenosine-specific kinase [candidate division Zixibacteria bacterium]